MRKLVIAAVAALVAAPAAAAQKIDFILNWVPGGDHAPYYYAKKLGWYQKEGIDLTLEPGKGSALATQKVGAGANPVGLADMGGALVAKSKGADTVAVFNVYANSPQGMYWLKSSGIKGIKDFPGKKIGNPAADGARTMWPALAKANGIDPKSVTWVNIDANAKLAALKARSVDITTSFYNLHHVFKRELVEVLMSDKISQTVALGWHDDARMKADYDLVRDYIGIDKPFDVKAVYTNEFLDKSIKMVPVKPFD